MYAQKIKATINETGQIILHESIRLNAGEVEIIILSEVQNFKPLSLQQIAKMPLAERHSYLKQFIYPTAQDFQDDPELIEFEVLDTVDWDLNND
jgi:hypothetical protein